MKEKLLVLTVMFFTLIICQPGFTEVEPDVKKYTFEITIGEWAVLPDLKVKSLMINNQIPGPEIRVKEGDWVEVTVINKTKLPHTIHWHGLFVDNEMDGVPLVTQDPIEKDEKFIYRFRAEPAGTHFWHCHWSTLLHISGGMYGAFIIEPKDPAKDINKIYDVKRDYSLMLDDFNPEWQEEMITMMEKMHGMEDKMNMEAEKTFASVEEYKEAIKKGYKSPYLKPIEIAEATYHTINGHPYPLTPPLKGKVGEAIRLRFMNLGDRAHYLHVHGMDALIVAIDGNLLANPQSVNTINTFPGGATDVILKPTKPGYWVFHDHAENGSTNNGHFPGGMVMVLSVEDENGFISDYQPKIILTQ